MLLLGEGLPREEVARGAEVGDQSVNVMPKPL